MNPKVYNIKSCRSCMERSPSQMFMLLQDKTELIYLIDKLLNDLLGETREMARTGSRFECKEVPGISVLDYLRRICKYAHCSESAFVAALIYIDRYQERVQNFIINYYNIHRLLIASLMIATKFLDDFYYKNDFYAKIGGIPAKEINLLELQLLTTFDFSLFISQEEFLTYLTRLDNYQKINA